MDRQLTIRFIGKDAGLQQSSAAAAAAVGKVGDEFKKSTQFTGAYIDTQGKLRDSQGQFVEIAKLSKEQLTALRMELAATGQNVEAFDEQLRRNNDGLKGLAATTGILGGAIAGLFGKGTQEYLAFSGAIRQAGVISSASAEEIKLLEEEVDRLGIVTSKSPAEIAKTSVALSRAGFSAQETSAALEGVARASEATGETLLTVGDITAKTVRTFGLTADSAGQIGDILVATANNTNTTVSSIGESLAYVGAQAKAADQPVEDIAIAIGLLGDAGIQGSSAGTGLAAALESLKQASAGAKSEFTDLVRGNEKRVAAFKLINTEVRNADGSMKSLIEILPILKTNLGALSKEDQDIVSKALFGTQGGRTIQTLLNATDERLQQVMQTIRTAEGQANESGEALLKGPGGALNLLAGSAASAAKEFGKLAALGLEPLVRSATAVINTFLSLPEPLQAAVVGVTGFVGALSGAVALTLTFQALQISSNAVLIANTAATVALTAAQKAQAAIIAVSTIANAVMNAELTKQNAALVLNAVGTKGAAIAVQAYALATGTASAATLALTSKLLLLAAQAGLVVGAVYAVSQVFKRSEGAQFAGELDEAVEALQKTRGESDKTAKATSSLRDEYSKFFKNIKDKGPIEGLQIALAELTGSAGELGTQWRIITREQRGAQLAQLATADAIASLGGSVTDTNDLLTKFGQVGKEVRDLGPGELKAFTAEVVKQTKALQEEIDLFESRKGQSKSLDQQLQNEISIRERLIGTLKNKITAQNGDTTAVEAATDATRELADVLDDLTGKYDRLNANAELTIDRALADVAKQEAEGLLSQAEAERRILVLERTALQAELDNNRALLKDLNAQRNQRTGSEKEAIDGEIVRVQKAIAKNERQIATDLARQRREDSAKAEKEAKEVARRQQQIAEDAAKERADLLKQAKEDEKRLRSERFTDVQREESVRFDQAEEQAGTAFDQQRRSLEAAFSDAQRSASALFDQQQQVRDEAFSSKSRTIEAAFNAAEREREEAFAQKLQAAELEFSARQNAEREAAESRFAEKRVEIERSLQLEDAGSSAERRELEAKFKAEDEAAARRQAAFAELEAEERAFEEQQRAEKAAFEEQQRLIQLKFDIGQQRIKEAYDQRKLEAEQMFETQKQAAIAEFEAMQRAEKASFEQQQRQLSREFQLEQENRERDFEAQQREVERAFNEQQRQLDRANAQAIQAILDRASQPTQSLRSGGVAEGGIVQVHKDEFIVPPKGARVISQMESRQMVNQFLLERSLVRSPIAAGQPLPIRSEAHDDSGISEKLDTLIKAVQLQPRPTLKAGGDTYNISGEADPSSAAARIALEQVRAMLRH